MSRTRWVIDDRTTFDEPIIAPEGIDSAYLLRLTTPAIIIGSGIEFVFSYRQFVYRLLPNTKSAYTYYWQTSRFLDYFFYVRKIRKISEINYGHIQEYMKFYLGNDADYNDSSVFSAIRMMFGKFRYDGLIDDIPYAQAENTIGSIRLNRKRKPRIKKMPFEKRIEHSNYDMLHDSIQGCRSITLQDLRAKVLISLLLYLDIKVGEAVKVKLEDLEIDKDGKKFVFYERSGAQHVVKLCCNSAQHLGDYQNVLASTTKAEFLIQNFNRNGLPTGRGIGPQTARNIILEYCERKSITQLNPREVTQARRYISPKEFNSSLSNLYG